MKSKSSSSPADALTQSSVSKDAAAEKPRPKLGNNQMTPSNGTANDQNDSAPNPNGRLQEHAAQVYQSPPIPERLMPDLPTFPLKYGWRTVYDEETKTCYDIPLTLREMLFPTEDDVGAVKMTQGPTHDLLIVLISELLRLYFGDRGWYFPTDVLIRWGQHGVNDKSPDIAAIPNAVVPDEENLSYLVGRDGPLPAAIIEVTSKSTRREDFVHKRDLYAAVGVEEYLIIDIRNNAAEAWQLYGYRLGKSPYYEQILCDAEGGVTLETLSLRFVPEQRTRINLYNSETGERLQYAREFRELAEVEAARAESEAARAESEATRAESEATRANQAEETVAALMSRIAELEKNQGS